MSYQKGSKVWLEDKDSAWVEVEVIDVKDKSVVVLLPLQRKKITVVADKILPWDMDDDLGGVDDMTKLMYLNEPGVLYNLSRTYAFNEIYMRLTLQRESVPSTPRGSTPFQSESSGESFYEDLHG